MGNRSAYDSVDIQTVFNQITGLSRSVLSGSVSFVSSVCVFLCVVYEMCALWVWSMLCERVYYMCLVCGHEYAWHAAVDVHMRVDVGKKVQ